MKGYISLIEALEEFGKENVEEVLNNVYGTTSYANLLKIQRDMYNGGSEIDEVNKILVYTFKNWGKYPFNGLVIKWVDKFLESLGVSVEKLGDNPISRIINYHTLVTKEYMGNEALEIKIPKDEKGVIDIVMKNCPYRQFCEETGNKKCVRGTVLKYILGDSSIITFLEKRDSECYLRLREGDKAVDEVINSIKEEERELHML